MVTFNVRKILVTSASAIRVLLILTALFMCLYVGVIQQPASADPGALVGVAVFGVLIVGVVIRRGAPELIRYEAGSHICVAIVFRTSAPIGLAHSWQKDAIRLPEVQASGMLLLAIILGPAFGFNAMDYTAGLVYIASGLVYLWLSAIRQARSLITSGESKAWFRERCSG